jgi:hypothetical protein
VIQAVPAAPVAPAALAAPIKLTAGSPFDLDDDTGYRAWRDWKLRHRARDAADLLVELDDPRRLTVGERQRLLARIARHGAALYRSRRVEEDPQLPRALGAQLGLVRLDANWLADEDGLSRIAVAGRARDGAPHEANGGPGKASDAARGEFIPYTDRAIGWHTDGYYHPEARRILGMILHCVRPARAGGETSIVDPALLYIALRERAPELVRALMHPQAMTIPAREDDAGAARAAQAGPVFSVVDGGHLHMRYTARTRSIAWRDDPVTRCAAQAITTLLAGELDGIVSFTLTPGMGLVGHNVLHARSAFADDAAAPRLLYRARYLDCVHAAAGPAARTRPGPAQRTDDTWEVACRTG